MEAVDSRQEQSGSRHRSRCRDGLSRRAQVPKGASLNKDNNKLVLTTKGGIPSHSFKIYKNISSQMRLASSRLLCEHPVMGPGGNLQSYPASPASLHESPNSWAESTRVPSGVCLSSVESPDYK